MEEDSAKKGNDFLNQIISITHPTKSEIKDVLVKLYADPIPSDYFWILSRQIRFASLSDLQTLDKTITEILQANHLKFLSASFAVANYSQRMNVSFSEIGLPSNIEDATYLAQIYSPDCVKISMDILLRYLDYPSNKIRKSAAFAIINCCTDRGKLYISALAALSKSETIEPLTFPFPIKSEDIRNAGIFTLCRFLLDEEAPTSLILEAVSPTLLSNNWKASSIEAQLFLSTLLLSNPTAFHKYDTIFEFIQVQYDANLLQPEFLSAVMQTYGTWAVKKIGIQLLPKLIDQFDDNGRILIPSIIPFLIIFPRKLQLDLQQFLVDRCKTKPFDADLIEMTTSSITAIAPTVSPFCGEFMEIAKHTIKAGYVATNLKPLLEPNGPPPPHEVNLVIVLDEEDKHDAGVQMTPSYESVETQVGTTN